VTPEDIAEPPSLVWSWSAAVLGAVYALPAALTTLDDVSRGFAFAVGMIPAAAIGLLPTRRARRVVAVVGALVGLSIFTGSLLGRVAWVAVVGLFVLGVAAAALARRMPRGGSLLLTLALPLVGVGVSYADDVGTAAGMAVIMLLGSVYAWLVSLAWPETTPRRRPAAPPPPGDYGVRVGLAGSTAAAIGFAFGFDHVGWACAAALLVMRPVAEMQQLRSVGRLASVVAGAIGSILVVRSSPPVAVYSLVLIALIASLAATRGSRWYVTPAFTTFIVFVLLLYSNPQTAGSRFGERVGETALGVALAYVFGLAIPARLQKSSK